VLAAEPALALDAHTATIRAPPQVGTLKCVALLAVRGYGVFRRRPDASQNILAVRGRTQVFRIDTQTVVTLMVQH
jgi:hypothetical protein